MNPIENPFAPGAGTPPPELAGRDELLSAAAIAIERCRRGLPTKSFLLVGLRGVGKTVLLDKMKSSAEATGIHTLRIEAPEMKSLPALLAPQLRQALLKLSLIDRAREKAQRALRALTGFAQGLKVKYQDIEVGFDLPHEPGLADNGDLEHDLLDLLSAVGEAARTADTAIACYIDELQYVEESQLAALISALHRTTQMQLPVLLIGAGLPQLRGRMGKAKSYAERLFDFPTLGPLPAAAIDKAIVKPLAKHHVEIAAQALQEIEERTKGYPYFVQEWGKHTWEVAQASPISLTDVQTASVLAIAAMDESFFRVRFDRLTPLEKRYLRGMADLGPGPHRSGDIADRLGREVNKLSMTRTNLIGKGMIWSPNHGDTAFTVPLFDEFMRRIMPGEDWRIE